MQIDECLTSMWACKTFAQYLVGLEKFTLQTDHKPLVPLMYTKDLDRASLRCLRLLMTLMRCKFEVIHVPASS